MSHLKDLNLVEDICPVSEFRAHATSFIQKVKEDHRPLILTQHGKSSAVLMDVRDYQELKEKLELLEAVETGREQVRQKQVTSHTGAKKQILSRFKK